MDSPSAASDRPASAEQTRWFAEQVHPHDGQLKAYLRGSFPSVRDVDDVVQESYLRVWKARAKQPIRSAKAFLFTIARRLAIDVVRRDRISPINALGDLSALTVIEDKAGVTDAINDLEKIELLGRAIGSLPHRCREIVTLHKIKGISQHEVAARLGLSEKTVENQIAIGVRRCEAWFEDRGIRNF